MLNRLLSSRRHSPLLLPPETARGVVGQFEFEAKNSGAKLVQAEHMLLALATNSATEAGRLLNECGLSHQQVASALRAEHRQSLAFAGAEPLDEKRSEATARNGPLPLGTSAKAAIKRAVIASHEDRPRRSRLQSTDLLLGILQAELGTVPRALAIAGVDRAALISRTRATL
jgi:D-alanyl-D-alanine carboxypeptidase